MPVQILPYSIAEYNTISEFAKSEKEFQLRQGEAFTLSTLRLLLLTHKLQNVFGIVLLHAQCELQQQGKVVKYKGTTSQWTLRDGDEFCGGAVFPRSWRVLRGEELMPYEFGCQPSVMTRNRSIDLTQEPYQPFLRDFVDSIEIGQYQNVIGLTLRPEHPAGMEIFQQTTGSKIFLPHGGVSLTTAAGGRSADTIKYNPEHFKHCFTTAWYFNAWDSEGNKIKQKQPIERRSIVFVGEENYRGMVTGLGFTRDSSDGDS